MNKKKYYVSVASGPHSGLINEEATTDDPYYDYEIEATPEQLLHLENLFREMEEADFKTYVEAHIPYETQERAQSSRVEDQQMKAVYQMIYQLGTEQTKQALQQTGLWQ